MQIFLLRYTQALITQMAQTAVCNRYHTVDQQLCRWLLLSLVLNIGSRATVRRKLAGLIEQGIVFRRTHAKDHRASLLMISASSFKLLSKYGGTLSSIAVSHFK
jgi:hypothetical protein